ncbi:MAG: hypothetical protein EXR69_12930 [Myxococcales bacterium]|nr:hypothetical protein [Myxococcales bacterium]
MLILLAVACAPSEVADTAGPAAGWIEEPLVCAAPDVSLDPSGTGHVATTEHYTLSIAGFDEDEVMNLATLAETAWGGLSAFFGAAIQGPLEVYIAADDAGFQAQMADDGISGVEGAGGYYDPGSGRAYLYRQPTAYYSRVLMLHEMVHQYHDATEGLLGLPGWYTEGVAEALSQHHWDGECVQLRVRPLLSWEDRAAEAQAEIDEAGLSGADLDVILAGGETSRPIAQELVRMLAGDPTLAGGFDSWRASVQAGGADAMDGAALASALLPTDELAAGLTAFVLVDQEPMQPVWMDWVPQGGDSALGFAEASSAARVKGEVSEFRVEIAWPTAGMIGAVYGFDEQTGDAELAFLGADGAVSRFAVIGGEVQWDTAGSVAPSAMVGWSQVAAATTSSITVGAGSVELQRLLPPAGGLALYATTGSFSSIQWTE